MNSIIRSRKRYNLRIGIIVHLILEIVMLLLFAAAILEWKEEQQFSALRVGISATYLVLLIINVLILVRKIYFPISDVEKKVNILLQSKQLKDESTPTDSPIDYSDYSLVDILKLLLKRESAAALMKKQAEINALQSQINPHFLYNTLEMIRGQAFCCNSPEIAETTKALADIFRYSISKKGSMIYLWEELANINSYMQIQQLRFNNKFSLETEIDPDAMNVKIPKLLIQPVVENALKHGLEIKRDKGHIKISAFCTADRIEVSVEDDGLGMAFEKLKEINDKLHGNGNVHPIVRDTYEGNTGSNRGDDRSSSNGSCDGRSSIGLVNINERIKLIYGPKYGVTVMSAQGIGTKITLTLGIIT